MVKFVSIVIPCRNEGAYIRACLDSLLNQDYSRESMEILVADGMSRDETRNILQEYAAQYPFIRWFDNPRKIVPTGLNILIQQAKGEVIVRVDVHADYTRDYLSQCLRHLTGHNVDNVGGVLETLPGSSGPAAQAIALALSSPFGVGNALFRTGGFNEPRLVDTVPFGCFKRAVFDRIGLFDEDLVRNQDDEFNARLIKNGGKILLVPAIISKYYARSSFAQLWRMYYQYGYFKPLTVLKLGGVMTWRQLIPAMFVGALAVCAAGSLFHYGFLWMFLLACSAYILVDLAASFLLAFRKGFHFFPYLIVAFFVIHFGYGTGYLIGIFQFMFLKRHLKSKIPDMAISR